MTASRLAGHRFREQRIQLSDWFAGFGIPSVGHFPSPLRRVIASPQAKRLLTALARVLNEAELDRQISAWLGNVAASRLVLDFSTESGGVRLKRVGTLSRLEILGSAEAIESTEENEVRRPMRLAQKLGLTPREAEVLFWPAYGKSNRDIGEIFSPHPRTLNKYLEHFFAKLAVENRSPPTALATQKMS